MTFKKIKLNRKKFYTELSLKIINKINKRKNVVNIFFTGGNSAKKLYENIADNSKKINIKSKVRIFQTDERIFEKRKNTNSENIKINFFKNCNKKKIFFFPMKIKNNKFLNKSTYYNCYHNHEIDLIILTLGDDGHIASLSSADRNIYSNKKICYTRYSSKIKNRVTIGPEYINKAKKIYVISNGKKKLEMFKILNNKNSYYKRVNKILSKAYFFFD